MPGAAAKAVAESENTNTIGARMCATCEIAFFIVISLIAALLVAGVTECVAARDARADMYFSHHPAEIFGVIRQVVEIGGVHIEDAPRRIEPCSAAHRPAACIAGIQNHIKRLAAAQRDGVGVEFGVHSPDRKSTRLNSSHGYISYAVFCLKKKKNTIQP